MPIAYENISKREHVPQGEDGISKKLITTDDCGPCVFFLVDCVFQGKKICYLKHYDFKEINDSNMSQLECFMSFLSIISIDLKHHIDIESIRPHDLDGKTGLHDCRLTIGGGDAHNSILIKSSFSLFLNPTTHYMLPNEVFNDPDIFYLYQQFIYKTIIFESVSEVLPDYEEDQSALKNDGLDYPSLLMKYSCTTNRLTMKIGWVSTSGSFSLATMQVKLHSQPPTTTTYYYWKKNVQEIHKFQQKAKPDENERLSDALSLIPNNGLFINIKIGINGFDLLGQHIFRCALEKGIQVVAINDKSIPLDNMVYMSKYNSTYGKFKGTISNYLNGTLIANGQVISVFMEKEASKIPWNQFDAEYIIESTDESTTIDKCQQHLQAGVKKVIITRSSSDVPMFVMGVNQDKYTGKERILSSASSTTNSLAPLVKVVHEKFGIIEGLMTIIHSYTPIQNIMDGPSDKGWRCGRGAAQNIIPLKTDVAKDIGKIIPDLNEKLTGIVLHVPTPNVSVIDLSIRLNTHAKYEEIRNAIKEAASGPLRNILAYTKDKVVSTDFIGDTHSSIFNAKPGISLNDNFVKLIAWCDHEYGYAHRIVDLMKYIARKDREYQA